MGILRYLFSFKGRINRAKLWLWWFIVLVLSVPERIIDPDQAGLFGPLSLAVPFSKTSPMVQGLVALGIVVLNVALLWPSVALTVKRLHDRNRGAIWLVPYYGVPLLSGAGAGWLASFGEKSPFPGVPAEAVAIGFWALLFVMSVVLLAMVIELYFMPGTEGDNRFGPDPLG